jgi:hypothetical protein
MGLAAAIQIQDQDLYQQSEVKGGEELGQLAQTSDGRFFVYAKAGGTLTAGQLTQPEASTANYVNRTLSIAQPVGSKSVTVTLGGTATQDQFAGQYLVVNDGVGEGQGAFPIAGNTAATAGNSNTTILTLHEGVRKALTSASDVSIVPSQESGVVQHTASSAIPTAGAPVIDVANGGYFWNQVGGIASILSDGAITKNAGGIPSASVAGAATIELAATVTQRIGYAPELTVTTEYSPFVLTLYGL